MEINRELPRCWCGTNIVDPKQAHLVRDGHVLCRQICMAAYEEVRRRESPQLQLQLVQPDRK